MDPCVKGCLRPGEEILIRAQRSRFAVIITWLSLPIFLLLVVCTTYLPAVIGMLTKAEARKNAAELLNVDSDSIGFGDALEAAWEQILSNVPTFVWVLIAFPFVMLVLAWIGYSAFTTLNLRRNELVQTNVRYIARTKSKLLFFTAEEVRNAVVEQSVWGKWFGFGNINISTNSGAITVHYICDPGFWKSKLLGIATQS